MTKCTLICVGRLKEDYFKALSAEYEKRLSGFCNLKIIEAEQAKTCTNPSDKEILAALEKESAAICGKIPKNAFVIALCIEGRTFSSEDFSKKLLNLANDNAKPEVCFIIGSSFGLADQIKQSADLKLSMSEMTFPHRFARIMLLEQLYRSFMIPSGKKYHK